MASCNQLLHGTFLHLIRKKCGLTSWKRFHRGPAKGRVVIGLLEMVQLLPHACACCISINLKTDLFLFQTHKHWYISTEFYFRQYMRYSVRCHIWKHLLLLWHKTEAWCGRWTGRRIWYETYNSVAIFTDTKCSNLETTLFVATQYIYNAILGDTLPEDM